MLLAAVSLGPRTEPPPPVITLGEGVRTVLADPSYKVEYGRGLEDAPILARITARTTPLRDLRALCRVLLLKCEVDEPLRTVTIRIGPGLEPVDRAREIRARLARLAEMTRVYGALPPKEIYAERVRLASLAQAQTDPEERRRMEERNDDLLGLLTPENALILRSLLADPDRSARVLSEPCTPTNRVELSPGAESVLAQLLSGRAVVGRTDYMDVGEMTPWEWGELLRFDEERRKEWLAIGAKAPIAQLRHSASASGVGCGLFVITPDESKLLASNGFALTVRKPLAPLPPGLARAVIEPVPIWTGGSSTVNSLWPLAEERGLNHASWLSGTNLGSSRAMTLEDHRGRGAPLDVILSDGWLGVYDTAKPRVAPSPAWKVFLTLRELFERVGGRPEGMRKALDALTKADLNGLEEIGIASGAIPERYRAITSGVRLLRAYARARASGPPSGPASDPLSGVTPYGELPPDARGDLRDFWGSPYIWNGYPQLLHPQNQGRIRETSLRATPDPDGGYVLRVEFPSAWNPLSNNSPLELRVACREITE